MTLPFIVILSVLFGCAVILISLKMLLTRITILETFIPPPVLPAHAPMNMSVKRIALESDGHVSKFAVA